MLRKIEIKRFRSCKDVSITNLPGIVALIGRNAAGKTNILRAIEWVARVACGAVTDDLLYRNVTPFDLGQPEISIVIELKKKTYIYEFRFSLNRLTGPQPGFTVDFEESVSVQENGSAPQEICSRKGGEIRTSDNGTVKIGNLAPCLPALASLFPATTPLVKQIRPLLDFFRRVRYYPLDEPSDAAERVHNANFVQDDEYRKWLAQYKQNESPGASVLMRLIYMESQGRLKELESILGKTGLELVDKIIVQKHSWPISGEDQEKSQDIHIVSFLVSRSDPKHMAPLTYSNLSCGTGRMLRMILSLLFDHDSIMLIEHPEDGIHTGLVKKVMANMRLNAASTQIIMSSHSLTLLNMLSPEEIRLITIEKGATHVRALSQNELRIANNFISEQGGNLADYVESVGE